jgi:phosphopantothenoylcysteine decarboxylase/phosphopantothenate--cysteine ligase
MLRNKRIILGVTGSIAAYKSTYIVREFIKAGAEVKVIMTDAARDFITPLTLSTLSKHPVLYKFTEDPEAGDWNNHVELGLWADALIIAPASANTLAKMTQGICDNLLMATFLSARCPVFIAPAMDLDMFAHESTTENLDILIERGVHVIEPQIGELASGLEGKGRMAEPEDIKAHLEAYFSVPGPLAGKQVLITAGPTQESIDPVRYIGNRSTGRMGFAIAEAARDMGAEVTLVSGPVHIPIPEGMADVVMVSSADEMFKAVIANSENSDIIIMSAAVADYRPASYSNTKVKKKEGVWSIEMERTKDILHHLGQHKKKGQILVGFALETDNELENARGKMERKNLDMIVLNSLKDKGAGFGHDTNKVTYVFRNGGMEETGLKAKMDVAKDLCQHICNLIK